MLCWRRNDIFSPPTADITVRKLKEFSEDTPLALKLRNTFVANIFFLSSRIHFESGIPIKCRKGDLMSAEVLPAQSFSCSGHLDLVWNIWIVADEPFLLFCFSITVSSSNDMPFSYLIHEKQINKKRNVSLLSNKSTVFLVKVCATNCCPKRYKVIYDGCPRLVLSPAYFRVCIGLKLCNTSAQFTFVAFIKGGVQPSCFICIPLQNQSIPEDKALAYSQNVSKSCTLSEYVTLMYRKM